LISAWNAICSYQNLVNGLGWAAIAFAGHKVAKTISLDIGEWGAMVIIQNIALLSIIGTLVALCFKRSRAALMRLAAKIMERPRAP
jgi:hypothetical protein